MTVCRYYLQGNCRFGERCRFEHVDPDDTENSYGNSNRRHDYGYQDRYRQQGGYQDRQNKYQDPDLSFGPRRHDNYERQNQRYVPEKYSQREHFDSNANYGQSQRYDSYSKNNQRSESDRYYSNQWSTSEKHNSSTRYDNSHKQRQSNADYHSGKHERNQYEWVSEDYKRRQQQQQQIGHASHDETSLYKSFSTDRVSFSFKDPDSEISKDSVSEKTLILADIIKEDVTAWELGNQWPFTCYYPFPDKDGFPGFKDISFEELRFEALKAEENNSFGSYVETVQKAILDVNNRRNQLKEPTEPLLSVIEKLRAGEHLSSESEVGGGFSLVNSNQTVTGGVITAESPFHTQNTAAPFSFKTIFDKDAPVQSSASSFSFKLPESEKLPGSTFSSSSTPESNIYTPMEQLSEQDKEQFHASTFTLGKIPTVPPPKVFCF